jgi:hypothetical protein
MGGPKVEAKNLGTGPSSKHSSLSQICLIYYTQLKVPWRLVSLCIQCNLMQQDDDKEMYGGTKGGS